MEGTGRVRVGVVDDHDLLVAGIRALFSMKNSPAEFVAGAGTVEGLLRTHRQFDVVVLDVRLNDGSDPDENVRRLAKEGWAVLLHADAQHREAGPILARTPARGLVWKNDPPRTLVQAVVTLGRGGSWASFSGTQTVDLTQRELEVLKLYATGMKYADCAASLEPPVSVESVKTYLARIRKRYHEAGRPASTRIELRQRALEDGLLPPEVGYHPSNSTAAHP